MDEQSKIVAEQQIVNKMRNSFEKKQRLSDI